MTAPESVAPQVVRLQASFQLAAPSPPQQQQQTVADPDETLPIPAPFSPGRGVPFSGTRSPEELAVMLGPSEAQPPPLQTGDDETAFLPRLELVAAQTGSFRDQLTPVAIPVLSLGEYAELRARLTVYGEGHAPTLARFGVTAEAVRDALRKRFAEYFQRDKPAQAQFIATMHEAIGRIRTERATAGA